MEFDGNLNREIREIDQREQIIIEATLKRVGEWLESKCEKHITMMVYSTPMKRDCGFCLNELLEALNQGKLPE